MLAKGTCMGLGYASGGVRMWGCAAYALTCVDLGTLGGDEDGRAEGSMCGGGEGRV